MDRCSTIIFNIFVSKQKNLIKEASSSEELKLIRSAISQKNKDNYDCLNLRLLKDKQQQQQQQQEQQQLRINFLGMNYSFLPITLL